MSLFLLGRDCDLSLLVVHLLVVDGLGVHTNSVFVALDY